MPQLFQQLIPARIRPKLWISKSTCGKDDPAGPISSCSRLKKEAFLLPVYPRNQTFAFDFHPLTLQMETQNLQHRRRLEGIGIQTAFLQLPAEQSHGGKLPGHLFRWKPLQQGSGASCISVVMRRGHMAVAQIATPIARRQEFLPDPCIPFQYKDTQTAVPCLCTGNRGHQPSGSTAEYRYIIRFHIASPLIL